MFLKVCLFNAVFKTILSFLTNIILCDYNIQFYLKKFGAINN